MSMNPEMLQKAAAGKGALITASSPARRVWITMTLMLAATSACGGSRMVSNKDIPVFTGAHEIRADSMSGVERTVSAIEEAFSYGDWFTRDVRTFEVADMTSWAAIRLFYNEHFRKGRFTLDTTSVVESESLGYMAWNRGEDDRQQSLGIVYVSDKTYGKSFLMLVLLTEKGQK